MRFGTGLRNFLDNLTANRALTKYLRLAITITICVLLAAVFLIQKKDTNAAGNISFVKEVASATAQSYTAANTLVLTVPAAGVAQGNTVIIFAGNNYSGVSAASVADSKGNIYTQDSISANSSNGTITTVLSGYMTNGLAAGDTIRVTYSAAASMRLALATEWNGIAATNRVDQKATATGNTAALATGTTAATTQDTELVIGSFGDGSTNETFTAGSGFTAFPTQLTSNLGTVYKKQWQQYKLVSAIGNQTAPALSSAASPYAGTVVTYKAQLNTAPDITPPTAPTNFAVTGNTATTISTSWTASTDDTAVTGYTLYNGTSAAGTFTGLTGTISGLTCGTSYSLGVDAYDAANNHSNQATLSAQTAACDTTAPSVNITAPADGSALTGVVSVNASASDNAAVAGVQFKLDGVNLQNEDTTAPYAINWDTSSVINGSHILTAVARDTSGNTATSIPINVTTSNTFNVSSPTPSPDASTQGVAVGNGFIDASDRQVIRTANNVVYVIASDDNACQGGGNGTIHIWKGSGSQPGNPYAPNAFTEQDASHRPTSTSTTDCTYNATAMMQSPDSRLDRAGTIHMAYVEGLTGTVYYQTYSTLTDTWGGRTAVGSGASVTDGISWPRTGQVALSLDSNDQPLIVYATSGSANSLQFTSHAGGSWTTPASIAIGTNIMHPSMVTALDGSFNLAWMNNSLATHSEIDYSKYTGGSWSIPEQVTLGDSNVLNNGDSDQGPGLTVDTSGRPIVVFMDGTPNGTDYVRMRYRDANGLWTDNTPPGGSGGASNPNGTWFAHTPQNYTSSSNANFVFLGHDINVQFGYQYQLGGLGASWGAYATLDPQSKTAPSSGDTCEPGTDGSASIRFDPSRDNNPNVIDVVYFDEQDDSDCAHHHARVMYKAVAIGAPAPDTTAPNVSVTNPAAGSLQHGNLTFSAVANDNIGVASVQFQVDGVNAGPALVSAPYNFSWNSLALGDGQHTVTAIAKDGAGNTATSTAVTFTTDNTNPGVSITAPSDGSTASGVTAISADTSDTNGIAGVQFKIDGANLGAEITASPYTYNWDTATASNGTHTITAVARDAIGNTSSSSVSVTVSNAPKPDTTPPTVTITSPAANATVSGTNVQLIASATDNVSVDTVYFQVDGVSYGAVCTATPYQISWDSTAYSNGPHTISAVATDTSGNTANTSIIVNVLNDLSPPTVNLTAPANNATVSGSINVSANASDDVAIANVQFKLDGANLSTADTTAPYQVNWATTSATNGTHSLTAVATDSSGKQTTSATITVTVNNGSQVLIGSQTVQTHADSDTGGQAETFQTTAAASGTISKMSYYIASGSTATNLSVGIYSDNNGKPGSLMASGSISAPVANSWNTITVTPAPLAAGTKYWMAVLGTGGTVKFRDSTGSTYKAYTSSQTNLTSLPATYTTTGTGYNDGNLSAYGSS